jgi:crossover junction endodeoxyribonuclease RusA
MYPDLPIEFNVIGTPVSSQSQNATAKQQWKTKVLEAARSVIENGSWAINEPKLSVTLFYFPDSIMVGDVDNIVKLTVDALWPHIIQDDNIVDRVVVQRFNPSSDYGFSSPTERLISAMAVADPVLYIRIAEVPIQGVQL